MIFPRSEKSPERNSDPGIFLSPYGMSVTFQPFRSSQINLPQGNGPAETTISPRLYGTFSTLSDDASFPVRDSSLVANETYHRSNLSLGSNHSAEERLDKSETSSAIIASLVPYSAQSALYHSTCNIIYVIKLCLTVVRR